MVAVGGAAIDLTPPPVKDFAISTFGSHDKTALVTGILVVLAVIAALIGVAATRRLRYGIAGLAAFAAVGLAAALTRPNAVPADVLPTLAGAAAGALALVRLVRAATDERGATGERTATGRHAVLAAGARTGRASSAPAMPTAAPGRTARQDHQAAYDLGTAREPGAHQDPGASWVPGAPPGAMAEPAAPGPAEPEVGVGPPAFGSKRNVTGGEGAAPPGAAPPGPPSPVGGTTSAAWPGRRQFVMNGSIALAAAGVSALAGRVLAERTSVARARAALRLPHPGRPGPRLPAGADLHIPGLSSFVTPNGPFYRVDTALILPQVPPASWQLRIHGMVDRELTLTFRELIRMPLIEDYITLTCVSNPVAGPYVGNAKWLGASLAKVLRLAGIRAGAEQLLCTSTDGFTSGTPVRTVMDGRDALLAVAMNGAPLPVAHGFPVRMVVPGLYGYVSATKWVTDIKVTTWAELGYWVPRGWSQRAPIKTESRIDVPNGNGTLRAGRTAVAGVAWAQHKGIDAVEVRVDRGPWHQARLASVPGIDTWRQWVWEWPATKGSHVIEARATDATGYTQTAVNTPPPPNGATGYPTVTVSVQ